MYILLNEKNEIISFSNIKQNGFIEIKDMDIDLNTYTYNVDLNTMKITQTIKEKVHSKDELLDTLKVTVSSGKVFYADTASRVDMSSAINIAKRDNLTSTQWKLAKEINGSKIAIVTLDELEEAIEKALLKKAQIINIK